MKKVRYIGDNGQNIGEMISEIHRHPEIGEIFEVDDDWKHPRTEDVIEDVKEEAEA